jgi:hypothetical protein
MVAHSDDFGRLDGDAFTVKHAVFPTSRRTEAEFEAAIVALHNVGLVTLYRVTTDKLVIQIEQFAAHQPGLSKRTASRFPEVSEGSRELHGAPVNSREIHGTPVNSRELPEQLNRIEEKGTEEKGTKPLQSRHTNAWTPEDPPTKDDKQEIGAFLKRFCDLYAKHRHGARYFVTSQKHVPLVRALLAAYGLPRLEKLAIVLLKTDDEWVQGTDRGIGILSTKASWLEERLASYEAKHGPIEVAS